MTIFKFYRHKNKWFYKERPGFLDGKEVDAFALDKVLGVTGVYKVVVHLPKEKENEYRITINNGFIEDAHAAIKGEHGYDLEEITEFFVRGVKS